MSLAVFAGQTALIYERVDMPLHGSFTHAATLANQRNRRIALALLIGVVAQ